jgi:4-amino-4-deoxy-L-arabinose transferase-like glycosyltransferase
MNKQVAAILGLMLALCLYLGMKINVIDIDSAQYASMSVEMLRGKNLLQLYDMGLDYLDKPPLIFWFSSFSISLFGISNFAFKLPSVLMALVGVYSVYGFSKLFYDKRTATTAAIMYGSCLAFFLMNNDVRTDTMLTGATMFAVWQLAAFSLTRKWTHLLLASIGLGLGMLAKGPLALMLPVFAFGTHWLLKREWKLIFNPSWIVAMVIIGIMLMPMCIGLYQQFDLHPEKVMYGKTGTSGLRFFFWTQSFGRVTGESTWNNHPDTFFLLHTTAWAFMPWTLFLLAGIIIGVKNMVQFIRGKIVDDKIEFISIGGFAVTMLALMSSKYQLSHYPYITYPLASVLAAVAFQKWYAVNTNALTKTVTVLQWIAMVGLWFILITASVYFFPSNIATAIVAVVVLLSLTVFVFFKEEKSQRLVVLSAATMLGCGVLLNGFVFPQILKYQSDSQVAITVNDLKVPKGKFVSFGMFSLRSTSFYRDEFVYALYTKEELTGRGEIYVYTTPAFINYLKEVDPNLSVVKEFDNFTVSRLSSTFINPATRSTVVEKRVLVKMKT